MQLRPPTVVLHSVTSRNPRFPFTFDLVFGIATSLGNLVKTDVKMKDFASILRALNFTEMSEATFVKYVDKIETSLAMYTPLLSSNNLTRATRVLILMITTLMGTVLNGFFVSSFVIDENLRNIGNIFMACTGVTDLVITSGVLPTSIVVLLSGAVDNATTCKVIQGTVQTSTYCYNAFYAFVALEIYQRVSQESPAPRPFVSKGIGILAALVFVISGVLSGAGIYYDLDYDFCGRTHQGDYVFRMTTAIIFLFVPGIVAFTFLVLSIVQVRRKALLHSQYRRSRQYKYDKSITKLNFIAYTTFVCSWLPYFIVVHRYPNASNAIFYESAYCGVFRSLVPGFLYGTVNSIFRNVYGDILGYCFCQYELYSPYRHSGRGLEMTTTTSSGEVRVHIMQQAVSIGSHPRCTCVTRNL
ncbi:unnamed protein product [Danaus chrysippus]|uniref:(African queen) hypothetical protein n=1 Tax=Danaus chrysippus TaxID=151541 RepID=A0A8J2Q147_9NEOP|nr:unnamed protein product [Danaus chrysippus]